MTRNVAGLCCFLLITVVLSACASNPVQEPETQTRRASRNNVELGLTYMRQGQRAIAMEKLRKAVELDPDFSTAHHGLALAYQEYEQTDLADKHFRRALSLDDTDSNLHNNYGAFLCSQKRFSDAETHFLAAVNDPGYATPDRAWENAGVCALKNNDYDKAEKYLRTALKLQPKLPAALLAMARVNFHRNDFFRSRAFLQRFEEVSNPTPETLWLAIETERSLGDEQAVNRNATLLESRFPDSAEARRLHKNSNKR